MNAESFLDMAGSVEEAAEKAANDGVKITGEFLVVEGDKRASAKITAEPVTAPVQNVYTGPALGEPVQTVDALLDEAGELLLLAIEAGADRDSVLIGVGGLLGYRGLIAVDDA